MQAVYEHLCPVCGGPLTFEEIKKGICFKKSLPLDAFYKVKGLEEFEQFFGRKLRALQRVWANRVLRHESFAIEAPTGTGKSSFGIAMAEFLAMKGKKCYILVPTTNLVKQAYDKIKNKSKVIVFHKDLKNKDEVLDKIKKGDFSILITTAAFLTKHFDKLEGNVFDYIFVDDLDAVLKASRNINKILFLLGYTFKDLRRSQEELEKIRKWKGILVIATATSKPGKSTQLLRQVLGIDASSSKHSLRNIEDYLLPSQHKEENLINVIKKLEDGIIVFTNTEDEANNLVKMLKDRGFKVGNAEHIDLFKEKELNILVGVSAPYGKLVRGLDLPTRVKYAVFYEAPVFRIKLKEEISDNLVKVLLSVFRNHETISKQYYALLQDINKAREIIKEILNDKNFKEYAIKGVVIKDEEILIPDIKTYIQASGRTSRMYSKGLTKGLSVVIDEEEILDAFAIRASFYDIDFKKWDEKEILLIKKEIEKERESMLAKGCAEEELIIPALMVVESPTKAKQISRFFGKPAIKIKNGQVFYEIFNGKYVLTITASLGHVVDLITRNYYHGVEVDLSSKSVVPHYDSIKKCASSGIQFVDENKQCDDLFDSKNIIENVRQVAYEEGWVIIATDPDTEGEKIAWDISNLAGFSKVARAEFHEITKNAVIHALNNLREIKQSQVDAQIVRRVEDRWIGFELSKKVQEYFKRSGLSAGRVQTPVLGWIIEAYDKSKEKKKECILHINDKKVIIEENCNYTDKVKVKVKVVKERKEEMMPLPPYTTDEVLKDANKILKLSATDAMNSLQKLFENGLITYHRTDSTRVSDKGLDVAKMFLGDKAVLRRWEYGEEGAHECIRPTKPLTKQDVLTMIEQGILRVSDTLSSKDLALYDLIFRRFMASQSPKILVTRVVYAFNVDGKMFEKEEIRRYEGRAYELYPYLGFPLDLKEGEYDGRIETRWVPKYYPLTQADAIRLMKERGIGRPSTYATILSKLLKRRYVVEKGRFLIPTSLGRKVYNFLMNNYEEYVSESTTRKIYEIMDKVEQGELEGNMVLIDLYKKIKAITYPSKII